MKVHVFFHDRCFDGAASAAVFTRLYQDCFHSDAEFVYTGLAHRASQLFDEKLFDGLTSMFRRDDILEEKRNLAAIIMHSPPEIIGVPGCAIAFYAPLSRRRVNIEETMSCFTDTIIVVGMDDAGKAFATLTDMIAQARKAMQARPGRPAKQIRDRRR